PPPLAHEVHRGAARGARLRPRAPRRLPRRRPRGRQLRPRRRLDRRHGRRRLRGPGWDRGGPHRVARRDRDRQPHRRARHRSAHGLRGRRHPPRRPGARPRPRRGPRAAGGGAGMRLTWAQPEDLLAHELVQSAAEGRDVTAVRERWVAAGGDPVPAVSGAGPVPASPELRRLARELLAELATVPAPPAPTEPDGWEEILAVLPPAPELPSLPDEAVYRERVLGAWTGRAAGCLLGKPVEKIPREGIEEILRATG